MFSVSFSLYCSETPKLDFIVNAYSAENEDEYLKSFANQIDSNGNDKKDEAGTSSTAMSSQCDNIIPPQATDPIDNNVQCVLTLLPDLNVHFIQKLLSRYESVEAAVSAYLEGNIPPDLDETFQGEIESEPNAPADGVSDALEAIQLNDGTQLATAHIKTKSIRRKTEKRILDDKSDIKDFHKRHYEYGYISEEEMYSKANEYDDEYDDSYDALAESESKSFAKILRVQNVKNDLVDEVDDESSDDDKPSEQRDKSRDFCENPEAVRARWAQHREAKYGAKRPAKAPPKYVFFGKMRKSAIFSILPCFHIHPYNFFFIHSNYDFVFFSPDKVMSLATLKVKVKRKAPSMLVATKARINPVEPITIAAMGLHSNGIAA